jgi:hypothetical protein
MKSYQVYDGEWYNFNLTGGKICCCDCGLVHKINFKIKGEIIQIQVFQDTRSTGQVRRHRKYTHRKFPLLAPPMNENLIKGLPDVIKE